MIEIACHNGNEGMLQKDIAKNQNISLKYLDSIISSLKLKQLIINSKGKGSGYVLMRPPEEITMLDIYTAFEKIEVVECVNNKNYCERSTHDCTANNYWIEFRKDFIDLLSRKTLKQVIEKTKYECLIYM
ncbi:Transcriptional regulator, BadM/Rrf2 family [uncultured Paludibacter sp.]|nr:Transcriptional regulator, BadM/Rrf2 family [uncultured Paludibacter sp.]